MTNTKKELNLSADLILSLIKGFLLSLLLTFFIHLLGKHSFGVNPNLDNYGTNVPLSASVYSAGFKCSLDESHWRKGDDSVTVGDFLGDNLTSAKLAAYVYATFDDHWTFILVTAIALSLLFFILKKYRIKIK